MNKYATAAGLAALAIALSACGGSDGGGVFSTSGPTYTKIADITGNRTFQTAGVTYNVGLGGFSNASTEKYGSGVTVAYTASSDSYTLTAPGGASESFGPAELTTGGAGPVLVTPPPNTVTYLKPNGLNRDQLSLTVPTVNGVALNYTVLGNWGTNIPNAATYHIAVGGAPTLTSDMPKSGTASYPTSVAGAVVSGGSAVGLADTSTASFSADFAAGTVSTTLNLAWPPVLSSAPIGVTPGTSPTSGTYSGSGTINAGGPGFTGTLNGPSATGVFSGLFLGPKAAEMGYAWALTGGTISGAGAVVGVKQ